MVGGDKCRGAGRGAGNSPAEVVSLGAMTWSSYGEFLAFAIVLILVPGPDFAVVTRNTLIGGRSRGRWAAFGVASSAAVQGSAAAAGLSALVVRAQPVFEAIKWSGVVYLVFLGVQAIASSAKGRYPPLAGPDPSMSRTGRWAGWRQGLLSNITNPKVLIFYLAVLPQFLHPGSGAVWVLAFAWSHALLSLLYLLVLSAGLHGARRFLQKRKVRRTLDASTGLLLLGFSAKLASEHV
jgi:threonine/homoserine/homoserine lactone efflux protein